MEARLSTMSFLQQSGAGFHVLVGKPLVGHDPESAQASLLVFAYLQVNRESGFAAKHHLGVNLVEAS